MKIGVDAVPLQKIHGGVSYYIFFLLDELIRLRPEDTFFLFVNQNTGDLQYFKRYGNVQISLFGPSFIGHSIWAQTTLSYACWLKKIDVFWGTTQSIPLLTKTRMKTILSLHDFVYLLCPETMSIYKKIYLKIFSRWMFKKAHAILPNSMGTGSKLKELYGLDYREVITPPLKPKLIFQEHAEFLEKFRLKSKEYLVIVGTLEPRKNLAELIHVFMVTLAEESLENVLPLVIIGGGGWKNEELLKTLNRAKEQYPDWFYLMGYRSDEEMALFLSGARYCLMVSKYEGYGMPLAEARVCKTTVICLDLPETVEAAENDGIFLNPQTWKKDLRFYLLRNSPFKQPKPAQYLPNREKSLQFSEIIDSL